MLGRAVRASTAKKRKSPQEPPKTQKRRKVTQQPERNALFWLLKSEPDFPLETVKKSSNQTATYSGVRGFQARGNLRDKMKAGDKAFFYHSGIKKPLIVGIVRIEKDPFVDTEQFDEATSSLLQRQARSVSKSKYYDSKATKDDPKWWSVDVTYESDLVVPYDTLKAHKPQIPNLAIFKQPRLSVSEVTEDEWNYILSLG